MDPNMNVQEQLELARAIEERTSAPDGGRGGTEWVLDHANGLAERVIALDEWRRRGGFDPYTVQSSIADLNAKLTVHSDSATKTAEYLTSTKPYGGAVAWHAHPCVVVYNVPVWIMPNGFCRVGNPDAPMINREHAGRVIKDIMVQGIIAADVD